MQVLLINPAFSYAGKDKFPLSLGYIAAVARQQGFDVTVVDENIGGTVPWEQVHQFDIIGLSVTTPAFPRARSLVSQLREKKTEHALIIAGGHHPTFRPEDLLRAGVNVVVRGEGEGIFAQLLRVPMPLCGLNDLDAIPGLSFVAESGKYSHNPLPPLQTDLTKIPFPAWEIFKYTQYVPMSVLTSRGCPYKCSYCAAAAFWQHHVRLRPVSNVIQELDALLKLHPYPYLKFQDSVLTAPKKRAADLFTALIERQYSFQWTCETRADALDGELLDLMVQAKCKTIMLGLESGSQAVLDKNNRRMQIDQLAETCQQIKRRGLGVRVSVIFGLPGETKDTAQETVRLLWALQPNVTFMNLATAYPGCALEGHTVAPHKDQWVRTFGGHGVGGQVILPDNMTSTQYHRIADYMYKEIHRLNRVNWVKETEF